MDNAVALVRAYLHVNGYFTVTEYPVLEALNGGKFRTVTDIDVMAFRFAGAGYRVVGAGSAGSPLTAFEPDEKLGVPGDRADMLIGEVKEGRGRLNKAMLHHETLQVALSRFGCCTAEHAPSMTAFLLRHGHATSPTGHQIRIVAFGSGEEDSVDGFRLIGLGHVISFLQEYLDKHWGVLHHGQFKDPAFGFLMTIKKALSLGSGYSIWQPAQTETPHSI